LVKIISNYPNFYII